MAKSKYASELKKNNYTFHPRRKFQLDYDELHTVHPDDDNSCYLVALDQRQLNVLLAMSTVFTRYHWVWGLPSPRSEWNDDKKQLWHDIETFIAEMESCLMNGCKVSDLVDAMNTISTTLDTKMDGVERLLRLQIEAVTGGSVDFASDEVVPAQANYNSTGLVPTLNKIEFDIFDRLSEIITVMQSLDKKFETDNWISPNQNLADILANSLYGNYPDIPRPFAGDGIADILDDQIKTLHKRFTMADSSLFNPFGEKNITEALETLLRVDKLTDVEFLPNIATIAKSTMTVGDSGIITMLKNWVKQFVHKSDLPQDMADWLNSLLETEAYFTHADILFMIAMASGSSNGNGGNIGTTIAQALKQLDLKTEITINNGCGCNSGCNNCQEVKQLSFDELLCGDDMVIDG